MASFYPSTEDLTELFHAIDEDIEEESSSNNGIKSSSELLIQGRASPPIRPGAREPPVHINLGSTPPTISNFERMINQRNTNDVVAKNIEKVQIQEETQTRTDLQAPVPSSSITFNRFNHSSPPSPTNHFTIPRPISRPSSVDWTLRLFRLQDFSFGKTVGTGTFGRVRLVNLRDHDKYFAMKIMRKTEIVRLHQVDHIFSEKFLLSRLNCPFIIRLYGTFKDQQNLFMLLEYAIGGELFTYLRRAGRFPLGTTKFYAAEIVCALEYMHNLNIVYRDLKPENLLLDARGHIKIADFGFAKIIPDNKTWTLCGTPEYLAPEIILGRGHGRPVDWWALGILIYEMMAGFPPYYDETPFLIYEKILAGKLEFPPHFDGPLCDLLTGLLQPDPQKRLGCGATGAFGVKSHPWFAGVNWDALSQKQIQAPFIPPVRHAGDTSNFEEYPEEELDMSDLAIGEDVSHIFSDF